MLHDHIAAAAGSYLLESHGETKTDVTAAMFAQRSAATDVRDTMPKQQQPWRAQMEEKFESTRETTMKKGRLLLLLSAEPETSTLLIGDDGTTPKVIPMRQDGVDPGVGSLLQLEFCVD